MVKLPLDEMCKTKEHISNDEMRTHIHGITPNDIKEKQGSSNLSQKVKELIKSKIIVGHDLDHDFGVLGFRVPSNLRVDTSIRFPWTAGKQYPALKDLAEIELNVKIQVDTHCSKEDALAALLIYVCKSLCRIIIIQAKNYQSWDDPLQYEEALMRKEKHILEKKISAKYQCKICDVSSHSETAHNQHLAGKKHRHKEFLAELDEQEWQTCSDSD